MDRLRFDGDDRMYQVAVGVRQVCRKDRRQAAAQLDEPACRGGGTTRNLSLCCKMPLAFGIGCEGEDDASAGFRWKASTPLALTPRYRSRSLAAV